MVYLTIACILLAILVIALLAVLNKRTKEKEYWEKQEKRAWLLKVALEKSCELPTIDSQEMATIEPQLEQLMNGAAADADVEEKMRELIMGLYEAKVKGREKKKSVKGE
ncbi:MAG: hypothetical protein WC370_04410 [Dehalococcoidales bacterium]|jgi:hypothetical protein